MCARAASSGTTPPYGAWQRWLRDHVAEHEPVVAHQGSGGLVAGRLDAENHKSALSSLSLDLALGVLPHDQRIFLVVSVVTAPDATGR